MTEANIIERARFKTWLRLWDLREQIHKAVEVGDIDQASSLIIAYLSTALARSYEDSNWEETARLFVDAVTANLIPRTLPFLRIVKDNHPPAWDYAGRDWYLHAHILADRYGWTLEYIANLDVEDALAMEQEILIDEQLTKEWQWALSEKSSGWDENTKEGKFIEYPRPDWMKSEPPPVKVIPMPRGLLPIGNVVSYVAPA